MRRPRLKAMKPSVQRPQDSFSRSTWMVSRRSRARKGERGWVDRTADARLLHAGCQQDGCSGRPVPVRSARRSSWSRPFPRSQRPSYGHAVPQLVARRGSPSPPTGPRRCTLSASSQISPRPPRARRWPMLAFGRCAGWRRRQRSFSENRSRMMKLTPNSSGHSRQSPPVDRRASRPGR